jgi:hypothetical protein
MGNGDAAEMPGMSLSVNGMLEYVNAKSLCSSVLEYITIFFFLGPPGLDSHFFTSSHSPLNMPSFAFWKSSKVDEARAPLLTAEEEIVVKDLDLDLNPGNEDSGVFMFEEEDVSEESPLKDTRSKIVSGNDPVPAPEAEATEEPWTNNGSQIETAQEIAGEGQLPSLTHESSPSLPPNPPSCNEALFPDTSHPSADEKHIEPVQQTQEASPQHPNHMSQPTKQTSATEPMSMRPDSALSRDRDSGVELSDDESIKTHSRPASLAMSDTTPHSRTPSLSSKPTTPAKSSQPRRLHRPTELNLSSTPAVSTRSELEQRYDLIRNSTTQSKAALRSPTELLKERLNMSPKKNHVEEKIRVFTPPRPIANGCWLPGPGAQIDAFTSTSVRARTERGSRPAWWCKFDKLVVFDGISIEGKFETRTSKGLSIARRRGEVETIVIPMDCAHCQEMLNRSEWKYDMRVCKRSVCWKCGERCRWEVEQEKRASEETTAVKPDGNRYRADSVLQDEHDGGADLMQRVGIEKGCTRSPVETIGGIGETLERAC